MTLACLYRITAPTGKSYIGATVQSLQQRVSGHFRAKTVVGSALRKHGLTNCVLEILVVGEPAYIYELEKNAIRKFETKVPNGYNVAPGGEGGGGKRTQATRRNISLALTGRTLSSAHKTNIRNAILGTEVSEETRQKIGNIHRGKKVSEEARRRMSVAHKGKRLSEETKKRMSESHKARHARNKRT